MPAASPEPVSPSTFTQVLPGAATDSLQTITSYIYRQKRYVAYISGRVLNILESPTKLVQVISFAKDLVAIAADAQTENLVIAARKEIWVLKPITEGWTKVWWEKTLSLAREDASDEVQCMSWGNEGELLIGGSCSLSLFSTRPVSRTATPTAFHSKEDLVEVRRPLWSKPLASAVQYAAFSPSGSLIATCCRHDRLVKIWRRLSFEEGLFDYTYLSHPGPVTHLEWRPQDVNTEEQRENGMSSRHEDDAEVLYTISTDGSLRVWKTGGLHDLEILSLHTTLDLVLAIPTSPNLTVNGSKASSKSPRYAFILSSGQFCAAVAAALTRNVEGKTNYTLEHIKEVMSNAPDVVVTLDGQGRMSAWGLQSNGRKRRPYTPGSEQAFHIAHAEDLVLKIRPNTCARFVPWFEGDHFHLLVHTFDGQITWWQGGVETFFSPSASGSERLESVAVWSGHRTQIERMSIAKATASLTSWSDDGHEVCWTQTNNGQLEFSYGTENSEDMKSTSKQPDIPFETGILTPSHGATNDEVAALVSEDGKNLIIIDLAQGYIEHRQEFRESVRSLKYFVPSSQHNILAVVFEKHVDILVQPRYGHHDDIAAWITAKSISIEGLGLLIHAVEWMPNGSLALAAGNGILLADNVVSAATLHLDVRQAIDMTEAQEATGVDLQWLSRKLKTPLPLWHPNLISHLIHSGQAQKATGVFHVLAERLKFWSEGDALSLFENEKDLSLREHSGVLTTETINDLLEQLKERDLPLLSNSGQQRLTRVLQAVAYASEHVNGLDSYALRYLFNWKLQCLHMEAARDPEATNAHSNAASSQPVVPQMHWREIAFAYHSTSQQPLLDILTLHYDNKITWTIARALAVTAWISDQVALAQVFEAIAQTTYRQVSPPDPTTPSLFFLALHKKQTLLGLWRIATWHKEQRATMNFLKRDFNQPDAKTAAKKNAYALMGKRRFEYAAAFFLLAGDGASAVSLLAGQCEDVMLAVAVARLYGGDSLEVVRKLIVDRLLPQAEEEGNRWMMSWCHSLVGEKSKAASALIKPLDGQRSWWQDDPVTMALYKDLRKESHEHEYVAVLRAATVLRKMGLWLAALHLVSEWEFKHPERKAPIDSQPTAPVKMNGSSTESPSMLDDFASLSLKPSRPPEPPSMLDNFAAPPAISDKEAREAKAAELLKKLKAKKEQAAGLTPEIVEKKKPAPTQFKEPDPNILLDSFGF
ncbi:WD40 repeat-like protein [Acrodontium crateriforme]|uniref:WD40 repeat-like protein n=1 Tax=Acrodontium crateriforme TaxID=150365 RepID=A0AAQ3R9F8_9PEZI|nr:WD40 repeat-like protein [Acrodontium crateriforme]